MISDDQLRKMPITEASIELSECGRYLIHKVTITTIKPVAYVKAVMAAKEE